MKFAVLERREDGINHWRWIDELGPPPAPALPGRKGHREEKSQTEKLGLM
jgi:hypothetical protein